MKQIEEACLDGNIEHFNFYLEKETGPRHHLLMKWSNKNGWNVLHVVAKGGNLIIFCKLVSYLKICEKTHSQKTVLHIASKFGHYDICDFIIKKNNDFKKYVCKKSSEGKNACHYAVESGSVNLLRLLVGTSYNKIHREDLTIFAVWRTELLDKNCI